MKKNQSSAVQQFNKPGPVCEGVENFSLSSSLVEISQSLSFARPHLTRSLQSSAPLARSRSLTLRSLTRSLLSQSMDSR